jgi:hypothetical protein
MAERGGTARHFHHPATSEHEDYANAIGGNPANTKAGLVARRARDLVLATNRTGRLLCVRER